MLFLLEYSIDTMKFEKISDTQVRCTLTSEDLSSRNMNINELAYGTQKAKDLFLEMMQRASSEVGFDADGMPIMIEAIPCRDQGIVLVITKVEDPEEVDTRFARFSPMPGDGKSPLETLIDMITEAIPGVNVPQPGLSGDAAKVLSHVHASFVFDTLDSAMEAAKALDGDFDGVNTLYKNPSSGEYYLYLETEGSDPLFYASTCNVLGEYAKVALHNDQGSSYLTEHYEVIIKDKALNVLAEI